LLVSRTGLGSQRTTAVASTRTDFAQEAFVVEQSRTTWRFENDGTGRRETFLRVKVQSEAGVQAWGQLAFPYNSANEQMDVVLVRVLKADGTIVTASTDAVQDLSSAVQRVAPVYTDTREKHITVPSLRPGEVLELSLATIVHTPLARGHFWGEHEFIRDGIVLDDRLEINVPDDRAITLKTRAGFEPTIARRDGRRVYEWRKARLTTDSHKDQDDEDLAAPPAKGERADVRLTTFASWDELGRWFGDLERPQRTPSAEIRRKAEELTAGRATDLERLEALYEYVATNVRYVSLSFGVGRYQPHAAQDVLQHQYGDCKDKHTLLASLATSIGLQVSAALIHSSAELDADFPSPSQFDHVMTRVALGSEQVWLDTTAEVAPFRLLSPTLRKKMTLVVGPGGAARLEESPAATPMPNTTAADIDATLSDAGALAARVRLTFSGDYELMMRTIFRSAPRAQWKTILESLSNRGGLDGEVSDWTVANPAALREPFSIEYRVTRPNVIDSKKLELALPLSDWTSIARTTSSADKTSPIALGAARQATYRFRIELPAQWEVRPPLPVSLTRDYADYKAAYALDGRRFTATRTLAIHQTELASTRRGDYAAFTRAVSGDLGQLLSLETSSALRVTTPHQTKVKELYNRGTDAVEQQRFAEAVTLLKRAVELEPTFPDAWTNLGRAYFGLRQVDAAIDAFKRQISINPYDLYAYNNLGLAYRTQQNFEGAEAAFQKQLEIDPLDAFAYESLGGMYLEEHRYEAAASALEKAVARSPKSAPVRVRLGEALLNLHEYERARAAFSRAVELDPSPLTWNDIAYQLTLTGTDLELAQRYAESAVAAVAAASRTTSLDHVTKRAVWHTVSIASYWDTLGWVYFAKGDVDRAATLVGAAWRVWQNPEVGDHLAQILDKQGRREEAIRTYALAMNAERPAPGIRERLARLAGGPDRADVLAQKYRDQLQRENTIAVNVTGAAGAVADFFVLLENRSGTPAVDAVSFISGDERLRKFSAALATADYKTTFPDTAPVKILRRGTLSCDSAGACHFELMRPDLAQAAQPE
jgi:tetratricopeptide (TPR) repeat protein